MRSAELAMLVRMGAADVWRHRLRSLLTMLGMVFGVGSVVAMLAVGEGASRQSLEAIRKMGSRNIIITSVKPPESGLEGVQRTAILDNHGLFYLDEVRIKETIPGVKRTVPARFMQKNAIYGALQVELRVVGTTAAWFEAIQRPILAGRVLTEEDADRASSVCVLTESGARKLLAGRSTIGQDIRISSATFTVVGIIRNEQSSAGVQMPDSETDAYIPMKAGLERFGSVEMKRSTGSFTASKVELGQIIVEMEEDDYVKPASRALEALLTTFHKRRDWRIDVPLALLEEASATKRRFNAVLGSIAAISLLVGGIGIMNIMLASVTERTREIGIRRAIGARRSHIVAQFLVETCVLSVGGGILGLAVGVALPLIVTHFSGIPTCIRPYSLLLAFGISAAIGIVFGLYPASRASRLDPVEALRRD